MAPTAGTSAASASNDSSSSSPEASTPTPPLPQGESTPARPRAGPSLLPNVTPFASPAAPGNASTSSLAPTNATASSSTAPPPNPLAELGLPTAESFDAWLPLCEFDSQDAADLALQTFALTHGFSISTKCSWPNRRYPSKWMRCTKGGTPRCRVPLDDRVRNRQSKRTDCPWMAIVAQQRSNGKWTLEVSNAHHNHGRDVAGSGNNLHASQRSFTPDEKAYIAQEVRASISRGETTRSQPLYEYVHTHNPNSRVTMRDVLNAIQKVKDAVVKEDPEKYEEVFNKMKDRKCAYCEETGHGRNTCQKRMRDRENGVEEPEEVGRKRQRAAQRVKEKEQALRRKEQAQQASAGEGSSGGVGSSSSSSAIAGPSRLAAAAAAAQASTSGSSSHQNAYQQQQQQAWQTYAPHMAPSEVGGLAAVSTWHPHGGGNNNGNQPHVYGGGGGNGGGVGMPSWPGGGGTASLYSAPMPPRGAERG